jgi:hypothetical protein
VDVAFACAPRKLRGVTAGLPGGLEDFSNFRPESSKNPVGTGFAKF